MAEDGKFRVEKFNNQNIPLWKRQMEYYSYQKDPYLPLSEKIKKPVAMTDVEWNILDKKALRTVRLCLAASVAFNILQTLEKLYEKPSASNKVFLMKWLFNMKMSEGGSVADHLNDFNTVTDRKSVV